MIVGVWVTQVVAIPKYSAEDTSLAVGNQAGEKTLIAIPAGTKISINVAGLHYNRKSSPFLRACSSGLRNATQRGIGTSHILSDQNGSWVNGIRTPSSRSLGARGGASDAGNQLCT